MGPLFGIQNKTKHTAKQNTQKTKHTENKAKQKQNKKQSKT